MIKRPIRYLVISDLHLGNSRCKVTSMIEQLISYFNDNSKTFSELDVLFIAGDVYDKLLHMGSDEAAEVSYWLSWICKYCLDRNIKLRMLEGTPSHDWKQVKIFAKSLSKLKNSGLDFKYVEDLSIEYMEDLGMHVLYVPDEWRANPNDTYSEILGLMNDLGIDKVDIGIMHGNFNFQLPSIVKCPKFTESDFLKIVKYYINIGHIHVSNVFDRILAQGSFGRIKHGEEGKKGGMMMTISLDDISFVFVPNKRATIFKSIKVNSDDMESVILELDKKLSKYPLDSHIGLVFKNDSLISGSMKDLKTRYNTLILTKKKEERFEDKDTNISLIKQEDISSSFISITKDNIHGLLLEELDVLSEDELIIFNQELKEAI